MASERVEKLELALVNLKTHMMSHDCEKCDVALAHFMGTMTEWLKPDKPKGTDVISSAIMALFARKGGK